ncbi:MULTISPECIES: ABC-F family ATP-binding cassette domain-containing protein [Asticcacaulis]|uniref:ABC-F family ATP-binding cassette domain-containing protein n=1 Tax=Asticcacaulis TaxID=76890 RepID=UPI001AEA25E5|nr:MULTISPECIES: ABC-F family ATP-binding cassette domain-containing protein [Asticcacaulis]MBP2158138.1 ATP-binding cassette subfamily F protein 3 [Asticcacaulis solisilvae]MDR6799183.1 ATP-binding cassette subfamily F protein 3 [Asticcacaulis sp. BE141]
MLQITNLTYDAYGRRFFDGATLSLTPGTKAGLIGLNGVGKSTLFKLILGRAQPGGGEITTPKAWRVASVDQEIAASPQHLIDAVLEIDTRRHNLLKALETADPIHQAEIHHDLYAIGADRAPAKAAEILSGLGFSNADLTRPISAFSGGWRMRAALAGALLAEPDLLLLDEPTNYLDLEGALWLESRLKRYPNAALMISHDRDLLNESVDAIVHVVGQKLDLYTGNYDNFERMRAEKARLNAANRAKQEAERAHLQSFVDRFRAKASKAAQAQSRMKKLEKLPPIAATVEDRVAPFILPSPEKELAPPILRLDDASVGYGDTVILRHINMRLDPDDRIGVLGVNGAGKSTFAKLLAGALTESHGTQWRDRRMTVAWFHQHQIEAMDPEDTPLEMMRRARPEETESRRRARLGSFGMTVEKVETKVKDLSGGERARLLLNMVAMDGPHLLILDEPTNHLDIDSRRALLDALNDYEGAVLIITHDRSLIELVADKLWLVNDGTVKTYTGSMDDYAKLVVERAKTATREEAQANAKEKPANVNTKDARKAAAAARNAIAPLKKKADELERQIETTGNQIKLLDLKLGDPDIYSKRPQEAVSLGKDKARLEEKLVALEAEWMEAAEVYETAKAEVGI